MEKEYLFGGCPQAIGHGEQDWRGGMLVTGIKTSRPKPGGHLKGGMGEHLFVISRENQFKACIFL